MTVRATAATHSPATRCGCSATGTTCTGVSSQDFASDLEYGATDRTHALTHRRGRIQGRDHEDSSRLYPIAVPQQPTRRWSSEYSHQPLEDFTSRLLGTQHSGWLDQARPASSQVNAQRCWWPGPRGCDLLVELMSYEGWQQGGLAARRTGITLVSGGGPLDYLVSYIAA